MATTKKNWYEIRATKTFDNIFLGEALVSDPKKLINRRIEVGLPEIMEKTQRFYVKVIFRIVQAEKDYALAEFDGQEIMREYISNIVRRGVTRVDNNIVVNTKDGAKIRVKGILLFARNVPYSICRKARKIMNEIIKKSAEENSFADFAKLIVTGELGKKMKEECEKLYPISVADIRKTEVIKGVINI
jgi:ribosomal protein S3AE